MPANSEAHVMIAIFSNQSLSKKLFVSSINLFFSLKSVHTFRKLWGLRRSRNNNFKLFSKFSRFYFVHLKKNSILLENKSELEMLLSLSECWISFAILFSILFPFLFYPLFYCLSEAHKLKQFDHFIILSTCLEHIFYMF